MRTQKHNRWYKNLISIMWVTLYDTNIYFAHSVIQRSQVHRQTNLKDDF